jgi:cysteine sulfinate desulfinase/cysteine desulfurase-like protein
MTQVIYLDYNATTPVDPQALDAMLPYLRDRFGNPSSSHAYGRAAHEAVERAREQVAGLLGARPDEIVFTGGGSEADNLAIKGIAEAHQERGNHIITARTEHPAVLVTCPLPGTARLQRHLSTGRCAGCRGPQRCREGHHVADNSGHDHAREQRNRLYPTNHGH